MPTKSYRDRETPESRILKSQLAHKKIVKIAYQVMQHNHITPDQIRTTEFELGFCTNWPRKIRRGNARSRMFYEGVVDKDQERQKAEATRPREGADANTIDTLQYSANDPTPEQAAATGSTQPSLLQKIS